MCACGGRNGGMVGCVWERENCMVIVCVLRVPRQRLIGVCVRTSPCDRACACSVVITTEALGMGIDLPCVGAVINYDAPFRMQQFKVGGKGASCAIMKSTSIGLAPPSPLSAQSRVLPVCVVVLEGPCYSRVLLSLKQRATYVCYPGVRPAQDVRPPGGAGGAGGRWWRRDHL